MSRFVWLAVLVLLALPGGVARAEQTKNTIVLEPSLVDLELAEDEGLRQTAFTIKNGYDVPVELSVLLQGIDEQRGVFLPVSDLAEQLSSSLKLSETQIIIPERSSRVVYMTITTPLLAPGGHYAALVVTQQKIGNSDVAIKQSISAGLFMVKRGTLVRSVEPKQISYGRTFWGKPDSADITLKNVGTVHVIPRASVTVYRGDTLVSKGVFNIDSRRVLPGRELQGTIPLQDVGATWWPGRLKVVFEYRADSAEEFRYSETMVWHIPPRFIVAGLASVAVLWMLIVLAKRTLKRPRKAKVSKTPQTALDEEGQRIVVRRIPGKPKPKKITVRDEEQVL
jgi:hypothetical protein